MGLEIDQGWNEDQFNSFLKLMLISNNKACRINCEFDNKIDFESLRSSLIEAANELTKRNENNVGILLLRVFENQPIFLLIKLEINKKDGKNIKRFCLNLFSTLFSEDTENDLQRHRNWEDSVSNINVQNKILKKLMSSDFLRSSINNYRMTRLQCCSVPNNPDYVLTTFLYTLFRSVDLEIERNINKDLDEEYKNRAHDIFIKDASVAKAQQGFSYQEHLVMLLAYLAKEDRSHQDFSLISEAAMPEAWNDIVFQWNEEVIIFQQKHHSLYANSVEEAYSESEVLGTEKDASILKYYQAYCKLKEQIKDPNHPLHRLKGTLENKKIKFIFFTNRSFPISKDLFLGKNKEIKFKKMNDHEIPLIALEGFEEVINKKEIWQIEKLPTTKLKLPSEKQDELDVFLQQFYLFSKQKNAEELLRHCRVIIKSPFGGFGQAVLADTFAHYVHQWFTTINPKKHSFNKKTIDKFFKNHEQCHYNLVKYSCYNYPEKEMKLLFERHMDKLKKLDCLQIIKQTTKKESSTNITILCQNPLLGIAIIQELFPAGERQIFTPFLEFSFPADEVKYALIVGETTEREEVVKKIKKKVAHIIQIKMGNITQEKEFLLNTKPENLSFLTDESPYFYVLRNSNLHFCLTDLLLLATAPLIGGLSEKEHSTYVPQNLTEKTVVLPYEKLETMLKIWTDQHKEKVERSWFTEKDPSGNSILRCKIEITLPHHISEKSIQKPKGKNFIWDDKNRKLYYVYAEKKDFGPALFKEKIDVTDNIDFESLEKKIIHSKDKLFKKHEGTPDVCKKVKISLRYHEMLPQNWYFSKNRKCIYYYPFGTATRCIVSWNDIFSNKTVSIIEAEAACGKTWHLRSKISSKQISHEDRIPLFIRIKDMEKIKNVDDPIPELIDFSLLPEHLRRIAKKDPKHFHLLLDGFDELLKECLEKFEKILKIIINKEYSVTITVRDYQITELQSLTSGIIIQQRLSKFDDDQIQECLKKSLEEKTEEVPQLLKTLKNQAQLNEWLGIPLHVALVSEWYKHSRQKFLDKKELSISEMFNFIIQHRIARNSERNRTDVYKILNEIAWFQIFGEDNRANIFQTKKHDFKKELLFSLERTGLLRDPFAKHPELFHRTFAEFLVAKKISRKLISDSCKNDAFNFKVIKLLYRTECRVIFHFFIELFKTHRTDIDMPYELSKQDQHDFERRWLEDAIGQPLHALNNSEDAKTIMLKSSIAETIAEESSILSPSQSVNSDKVIKEFEEKYSGLCRLNRHTHTSYLRKAFENYTVIADPEKQKVFYELIRQANIRLFLREDYPASGNDSLFEKYKEINEFDIDKIFTMFDELQKISENYHWTRDGSGSGNSYVFKCWSQGGYADVDFAFPILRRLGVHLNIIHAFYIRLYVSYGGYSVQNNANVINAGLKNIKKIKEDTDLRAVFSSVLIFLGIIDDWKSKQEHPELSIKTFKQVVNAFKRLLDADENAINPKAKLFIHILFVDFITYFNMRCYLIFNKENKISTLTLISHDGFVEETGISFSAKEQSTCQKIREQLTRRYQGITRFTRFFEVWKTLLPLFELDNEIEFDLSARLEKAKIDLEKCKEEMDDLVLSEEGLSSDRNFIINQKRQQTEERGSPSNRKRKGLGSDHFEFEE